MHTAGFVPTMAHMDMLQALLLDPAAPRITVYNESTGARMDFSGQTLENWASKIANMLAEELELDEDSTIAIDLPVSWQSAVIAIGGLARGVTVTMDPEEDADVVFTSPDKAEAFPNSDVVLVTDDPFGRGVAETGGDVPAGAIDFGPTVRFYGDVYPEPTTPLDQLVIPSSADRVLSTGWKDWESFVQAVLSPLAAGGSAVVVAGLTTAERLEAIADNEKVTARI